MRALRSAHSSCLPPAAGPTAEIIKRLRLKRRIYRETAAHGHFGRIGPGFTWEETDMVLVLRKPAGP